MSKLIIKDPKYLSQRDEDSFFGWLQSIPAVRSVTGKGRTLELDVIKLGADEDSLRKILALFLRYDVEMRGLSRFRTKSNESWFAKNPQAFWYKKVFGPLEK